MEGKIWSLDAIRARLEHYNLRAVAEASGVKYQTLLLLMKHDERDPSYSTVKLLSDYLDNWK
jgi:hypothetical protein